MALRTPLRLSLLGSVAVLAACVDGTAPDAPGVTPNEPLAAMSPQAQSRIEALFQRISPEVHGLAGTVFTDNDERINKVVIGVANPNAVRGIRTAMARMGVADADYQVEVTPEIHAVKTLQDRFDPAVAGIQVNFTQYVCSIGFNASFGGRAAFVTASHCTATQGGVESTLYYQPLKSSFPTAIAQEFADPPYVKNGAGCPKGKKCRYSDASASYYINGATSTLGAIAQTTGVNNGSLTTVSTNFSVAGGDFTTANVPVGTTIQKVGRTTGWTSGQVTRTCANTSVSGSTVYLICQWFVSDPNGAVVVKGGDSGSGVWKSAGTNSATIEGILWGGSSDNKTFVYSPLAAVARELGTFSVK